MTDIPTDELLAGLAAAGRDTLIERMGIEIVEAGPERVVATMPVAGNTQPYGLLHGGASCVLAETIGSVGAALHAARSGRISVGIELNASHHRAAAAGIVTGTATSLQLGSALASYEVLVTDEHGRRICTARITSILRDRPPGT
jgi:1,4-dihydroxy-2-naphthoyl-CoA hydrolase